MYKKQWWKKEGGGVNRGERRGIKGEAMEFVEDSNGEDKERQINCIRKEEIRDIRCKRGYKRNKNFPD